MNEEAIELEVEEINQSWRPHHDLQILPSKLPPKAEGKLWPLMEMSSFTPLVGKLLSSTTLHPGCNRRKERFRLGSCPRNVIILVVTVILCAGWTQMIPTYTPVISRVLRFYSLRIFLRSDTRMMFFFKDHMWNHFAAIDFVLNFTSKPVGKPGDLLWPWHCFKKISELSPEEPFCWIKKSSSPKSKPTTFGIQKKYKYHPWDKHHRFFESKSLIIHPKKKSASQKKPWIRCVGKKYTHSMGLISLASLFQFKPPRRREISDLHVLASWLSKHTPFSESRNGNARDDPNVRWAM